MDSEHRHELEENWLANKLAKTIEQVGPYSSTILAGLLVAVAAGVGWIAYQSTTSANRAQAWRSYTLAVEGSRPSLEALEIAAEENPGTPVEDWSLITLADGRLWNASNLYLSDKRKAEEALEEAEQLYDSLQSAGEAAIADRAVYGLARVAEMRGDLDEARQLFARVAGPFAELATRRAEELDSPRTKEAYAWLTGVEIATDEKSDSDAATADPDASLDALLQSLDSADEDSADEDSADEDSAVDEGADEEGSSEEASPAEDSADAAESE